MKTNLRDLLHSINVLDIDIDVAVDGIDSIAVCSPVKFTPKGLNRFEKALNIETEGSIVGMQSDDEECEEAWTLLKSLAGYCPCDDFDQWFEGDEATEI